MNLQEQFYRETFDEAGRVTDVRITYPENFNFGYDVVDVIAEQEPDKCALVWCNTEQEEHVFTFSEICTKSNQAANVLKNAGISRGDRVMLALKRHYEYWFLAIALHKIGAVMIPVTHMLTVHDFAYRMRSARVKAVICTPNNGVPEAVLGAMKELSLTPEDCRLWSVQKTIAGFVNFTEELQQASAEWMRQETKATDPMVLYFTSGTSGDPKGVIHDFTYPLAHYVTAKYWQKTKENGLHFTVSETGWAKASWGKLYGQWLTGCAVMVYDFDNFEPKQMVEIINRHHVTSFCAPPTIYRYLTRKKSLEIPCVESAVTAGEFLSPEVFAEFDAHTGLTLREGYGQTETTLLLANFEDATAVASSLGTPSPLYQVELRSRDGSPTPTGEIGEIVVVPKDGKRPVGIFCSYLDDPDRYEEMWRGGVYHTGDAAWQDESGHFWFHGRFDDIIKSSGFRIGPYEVENVLNTHPAVLESSVIGVPDRLRGQAIKAIIVLAPGYAPTKETDHEIREYCNSRLAEYKWIRQIEFVPEMPKTISGKIRKAEQRRVAGGC